ncbi:ion channel [Achlya hypogyna]|uniref:Ion channel n=1 Tax=Achlya hypogyna TaxID=1202772 RepID=A0A1V9YQH4_ACHHY|nr:ion channel [Achlya hypogyna]
MRGVIESTDPPSGEDDAFEVNPVAEAQPSVLQRWLYRLDTFISNERGQAVTLVVLCLVFAFSLAPLVVWACYFSYANAVWRVWLYMSDTGTQHLDVEWQERAVALFLTLLGFAYFAVVVGFVVDAIREKMEELKEGRSQVVEVGHTLMLGWSDKSVTFLEEICLANESEHGGTVVVLADNSKEEMEAILHASLHKRLGTNIIIRHGSPLITADLNRVGAPYARSICVMSSGSDANKSDSNLLRVILTLRSLKELAGHIVVDVCDGDNDALLRLVGGNVVETVESHDIIGGMIVKCSRSPGLSKVYSALLGFGGNEFYIAQWPECDGVPFGELPERFMDAVPIGIQDVTGRVWIKPDKNRQVRAGEGILVLAEDNDTYKAAAPVEIDMGGVLPLEIPTPASQKLLVAGWRRDIRNMLRLIDNLSITGSTVVLMNEVPVAERESTFLDEGFSTASLRHITVEHRVGNPAVRRHVNALDLATFDRYIVVADMQREGNILDSDSHVLATVLTIRSCEDEQNDRKMHHWLADKVAQGVRAHSTAHKKPCIAEILDPRTQKTLEDNQGVGLSSDYIQSNQLVSRMIAMISENRLVKGILDELLSARGASFDVVPFKRYCGRLETLSFFQIAKRALAAANEVVCGYQRVNSLEPSVLNPPHKTTPQTWHDYEFIIIRGGINQRQSQLLMASADAFNYQLKRANFRRFVQGQNAPCDTAIAEATKKDPAFKKTQLSSRMYDLWAMTEEISALLRDGVLPRNAGELVTEY